MKREDCRDENEWMLKVPRTPEQLALLRSQAVDALIRDFGGVQALAVFTCDGCKIANVCTLCFDHYNVGGDCLYEK